MLVQFVSGISDLNLARYIKIMIYGQSMDIKSRSAVSVKNYVTYHPGVAR